MFFVQLRARAGARCSPIASAWHFARGARVVQRGPRAPAQGRGGRRAPDRPRRSIGGPTRVRQRRTGAGEHAARGPWRLPAWTSILSGVLERGRRSPSRWRSAGACGVSPIADRCGVALGTVVNLGYFAFFWQPRRPDPGHAADAPQGRPRAGRPGAAHVGQRRSGATSCSCSAPRSSTSASLWAFVDPRRKAWHDIGGPDDRDRRRGRGRQPQDRRGLRGDRREDRRRGGHDRGRAPGRPGRGRSTTIRATTPPSRSSRRIVAVEAARPVST